MIFGIFGGEKKRIAETINAARSGDTAKVKQLLAKGVDINAAEPESGDTPLLAAIDKGQWSTAEYLLTQKPDLTQEDHNGNSPLYLAVSNGDSVIEFVKQLLDGGSPLELGPKTGSNAGATPVHICCATGANQCLEALLSHGASACSRLPDGSTPLHTAAIGGDQRTVELLCKSGAEVDATNNEKRTPLHNCGITGNARVAEALIQQGAAVDDADAEGCTPLMRAVMKNHAEVARVVLDHGANPDVVVQTGDTPLYPLFIAAMNGYDDVVRVLLDKGVNVTAKVHGSASPVDAAKHNGNEAAAKMIAASIKAKKAAIKAEVGPVKEVAALWKKIIRSLEQQDFNSMRKLTVSKHFDAVEPEARLLTWTILGDVKQVRDLIDLGINPNKTYSDALSGISSLYSAIGFSGSHEIASALLNAGADPNLVWENGATPIFEALTEKRADLLNLLISKGADVNVKMSNGKTPLIQAAINNSRICVDQLLDAGADINVAPLANGLGAFGAAVDSLKMDMALHLLKRGAKPNFGTVDTLGLAVAEFGSMDLILEIEKAGGSIIRDDQLDRVAFVGSRNKDWHVLEYLLEHGADLKADNDLGYTPMILSVLRGHTELVKKYAERGDDASIRDVDGDTALSLAIEKENSEMISILMKHGAEVRNYQGLSDKVAMLEASKDGALGTILNLRDAGVSINIEDSDGNSPIILATRSGHLGVVRSLFHLGADINHRNHEGKSAANIATEMDNSKLLATMREFVAEDAIPEGMKDLPVGGFYDAGDVMFGRTSHPGKENPPYGGDADEDPDAYLHEDEDEDEDAQLQLSDEVSSKLDQLEELINTPHIRDRLPEGHHEGITDRINLIRSQGEDSVPRAQLDDLFELAEILASQPESEEPPSPLFEAATEGDLKQFRMLIKAGADVKETMPDGTTLLMTAAENGHNDIVQELIKLGVDVNQRRSDTFSAFLFASFLGHEDVVKTLAKHGADVNAAYEIGSSQGSSGNQTALTVAAARGNCPMCALLLKLGADLNVVSDTGYTPLMWSLANGSSEDAAELLLKAGANPDPDAESRIAISTSTTPLILASTNGMTSIVKALLLRKVAVDKTDGDGWTALKHASNHGHEEVVAHLLKAGASPNIADREGWTALINAAGKGHIEICKALLKAGADVNATGARGRTPLLQAVGARSDSKALDALKKLKRMLSGGDDDEEEGVEDESSLDLIRALLKAGANPNALHDGVSLLSEAIENEDEELAKLLKKHGATEVASQASRQMEGVDGPESEEGKAFLVAAMQADCKGLRDLVLAGVDVNYLSAQGQTALGLLLAGLHDESNGRLFRRNAEQCIDLLLSHGADPGLGDPSPFVLAAMGRRLHLVQTMLAAGVDINKSIGEGQTALFMSLLAPEAGQPADDRCALALLKAGADSSLKHESGAMPIHLAAASNYLGALQALLDRRPQDVDAKTNIGITPLMMAATEGHAEAVHLLLRFGANRALKNDEGRTAKEVAIKNGNEDLVPLLS